MALKVKPLDKSAGGPAQVKPGKRLYLTADRKALVGEGDPKAAILYCPNEEYQVPREEYERLTGKPQPEPPGPKSEPKPKKESKAKE